MKEKDKIKIVKRMIVLCWLSLIGCFLIKVFGGNYFEIVSTNEKFINVCKWIDGNFVKEIIRFAFANLCFYIYTCSIMRNKMNKKQLIIFEIAMILMTVAKYINSNIGFIADCVTMLAVPLVFSGWKWKNTLLGFGLINAFQIISLITRNLGVSILEAPMLIELILQIDYYIMLVLYYLYAVKLKGEKNNG